MRSWRLNLFLALALGFSLALHWLVGVNVHKPNWEYAPAMAHSARLDSFAATPLLPSGAVLQPPLPGTIPRGRKPLPYGPGPEEAARAGRELSNPVAVSDPRLPKRGARLWRAFCSPCHGEGGLGDGPVALRGFPPPPSLHLDHAKGLPDGQVFHIVSLGQGNMPGYASLIDVEDRWLLVSYVRLLQGSSPKP